MPIPDFQSLMLPALKAFAGGGQPPLSQVRERIAVAEGLSAEDIREMLPSGRQAVFTNRVSWAVIYMERTGLRVSRCGGCYVVLEYCKGAVKTCHDQGSGRSGAVVSTTVVSADLDGEGGDER